MMFDDVGHGFDLDVVVHGFDQVRSGTIPRSRVEQRGDDDTGPGVSKKLGGVAYKPDFLLDCVLLRDNLREPSTLRNTISRRGERRSLLRTDIVVL